MSIFCPKKIEILLLVHCSDNSYQTEKDQVIAKMQSQIAEINTIWGRTNGPFSDAILFESNTYATVRLTFPSIDIEDIGHSLKHELYHYVHKDVTYRYIGEVISSTLINYVNGVATFELIVRKFNTNNQTFATKNAVCRKMGWPELPEEVLKFKLLSCYFE